jgi:hypothetical protein
MLVGVVLRSVDSSTIRENLLPRRGLHNESKLCCPNTLVTIAVVLVRPHAKPRAIFESLQTFAIAFTKWSMTANGRLCSATSALSRISPKKDKNDSFKEFKLHI